MTRRTDAAPATPASSVILLRDSTAGPQILYLRRHPELAFHGGHWVFPGGRIDAEDFLDDVDDEQAAARRAAAREALEEAGLHVDPAHLLPVGHWTTPEASPIRFATWFFVAPAGSDEVHVDGTEIQEYCWRRPEDALRAAHAGAMPLGPPSFALSTRLVGFGSVADLLDTVKGWPMERLLGRMLPVEGGQVVLYPQDAAYNSGRLEAPGPRHRLWLVRAGWKYQRDL